MVLTDIFALCGVIAAVFLAAIVVALVIMFG